MTYKEGQKIKAKVQEILQETMKETWSRKVMHGKFPKDLDNEDIDVEQSFQWMKHSGLKGKTDGLIIAEQDQTLTNRY